MKFRNRLILATLIMAGSVSYSTYKFAAYLNYQPGLGNPLFVYEGIKFYYPWSYITWFSKFYSYAPHAFHATAIYFLIGVILALFILIGGKTKKQLSSHGTARWATYDDLKQMELISSSGVVVGLYDSKLKKWLSAKLKAFEVVKKEKEAYAEMTFDNNLNKKLDVLKNKFFKLKEEQSTYEFGSIIYRQYQIKIDAIQNKLDNPPKWDAKKHNFYSVYPYTWLYKKLFNLYKKLDHFYLRDNSNKHLAVIAPTRSGKGVGLIIPTLLGSWKSSVIVNDIKSENWGVTAGYRKKMGHTVIKFEPTADDGSTARWNPLDEIPIGHPEEVSAAQNLAAIIADYEGKGKPDHWTANAANVIMAAILHLRYAHYADPENYPTNPNLYTVAAFLKANFEPMVEEDENGNLKQSFDKDNNPLFNAVGFVENLEKLQGFEHVPDAGIDIEEWDKNQNKYIKRHFTPADLKKIYPDAKSLNEFPNVHPIIFQAFVEIGAKAEQELCSIVSTANTALKEYLDPVLARNTSVSDFCIDDIMNYKKPVSLYLVTPPSDLLRLAPIFRLFFEFMVRHHAKVIGEYHGGQAKSVYKHKCLFLMDEFSSLGNLQSFAATLSYIAGYGMKVFLINQGLPQINGIYGKDNQILMNCHLQIFYAPNDNDTGKYAETQLGNETIIVESQSINAGFFKKKTSISKSEQARALMTSDEIKRLGDREIISASGFPPVLTDKVKYYENNYFTDRLMDAPYVSDIIRNNPYPARDKRIKEKNKHINNNNFKYTYKKDIS